MTLAGQLDIPVIGPETAAGKNHARAEWAVTGVCDILRTGVTDVGGITLAIKTLKTLHLAEALNMDCEVHGGGSGNLALFGGSTASRWYERGLLHPHTDHDEPPPHLRSIIDPMDGRGVVPLPQAAGLGDDYDLEYIAARTLTRW